MKIWNHLFGRGIGEGATNYWECPRDFNYGPGGSITLSAEGTGRDLTQQQQNFIAWVEEKYSFLIGKLIPLIEYQFRPWIPQLTIEGFTAEFIPIYLSIPACRQQPVKWEIIFATDNNQFVTVSMLGSEPQHVHING